MALLKFLFNINKLKYHSEIEKRAHNRLINGLDKDKVSKFFVLNHFETIKNDPIRPICPSFDIWCDVCISTLGAQFLSKAKRFGALTVVWFDQIMPLSKATYISTTHLALTILIFA